MRTRYFGISTRLALAAASIAIGASFIPLERSVTPAHASNSIGVQGPSVALLVTKPGALHTSLYLASPGGGTPSAPVATFNHLPNAFVRGRVVPGKSIVLAVADTDSSRDKSFNSSLFRLIPHTPPAEICNSIVYGSRPLIMESGRVFVARGKAGPELPTQSISNLRTDELFIDEVDLGSGTLHTIHSHSGYLAHLAGAYLNEIVLYRVSQAGADIVAVDVNSGNVRPILSKLPPFARDFSIDESNGQLVFRGRHESNSKLWTIERIDLHTLARTRLYENPSMTLSPHVWPTGGIIYNPYAQSGMAFLGSPSPLSAPLGQGMDAVAGISSDGQWAAIEHTLPSELPIPFVVEVNTGKVSTLAVPSGSRAEIAGFISEGKEGSQ